MTAERLEVEIMNAQEKKLGHLRLTPINDYKTEVEGDFLSNGIWHMPLAKVKRMLELTVKGKYRRGYELKYIQITNHTQNEKMVPEEIPGSV